MFKHVRGCWGLDLSPLEKYVLVYLSSRANSDDECFPSLQTIVKDTGMSRSSVCRALASLKNHGLVEKVEYSHRRSNKYRVMIETGVSMSTQGCHNETPMVSPRDPNGVPMTPLIEGISKGSEKGSVKGGCSPPDNVVQFPLVPVGEKVMAEFKPGMTAAEAMAEMKEKRAWTPKTLKGRIEKAWKEGVPKHHPEVGYVALKEKEKGQLGMLAKIVQPQMDCVLVIATAIEWWGEFTEYVKGNHELKGRPPVPDAGFMLKYAGDLVYWTRLHLSAPSEKAAKVKGTMPKLPGKFHE